MTNNPLALSEEKTAILNRLRSAEGHLQGVITMLVSGESCEHILHQLNAVEAALCAAGRALRDCEFQRSSEIITHSPDANIRADEMRRLAALYELSARHLTFAEFTERKSDEQRS